MHKHMSIISSSSRMMMKARYPSFSWSVMPMLLMLLAAATQYVESCDRPPCIKYPVHADSQTIKLVSEKESDIKHAITSNFDDIKDIVSIRPLDYNGLVMMEMTSAIVTTKDNKSYCMLIDWRRERDDHKVNRVRREFTFPSKGEQIRECSTNYVVVDKVMVCWNDEKSCSRKPKVPTDEIESLIRKKEHEIIDYITSKRDPKFGDIRDITSIKAIDYVDSQHKDKPAMVSIMATTDGEYPYCYVVNFKEDSSSSNPQIKDIKLKFEIRGDVTHNQKCSATRVLMSPMIIGEYDGDVRDINYKYNSG